MNEKNLRQAIAWLEEWPEEKFNMNEFYQTLNRDDKDFNCATSLSRAKREWDAKPCNTVCCFAGIIQMQLDDVDGHSAIETATRFLELDRDTADWLFYPTRYPGSKPSKAQVLARAYMLLREEAAPNG